MALETVVYQQDLFSYSNNNNNLFGGGGGGGGGGCWEAGCDFDDLAAKFDNVLQENYSSSISSQQWSTSPNASSADFQFAGQELDFHVLNQEVFDAKPEAGYSSIIVDASARSKRRRSRPKKNQEEIERQRMAHIAVERNRRKQMNEYLAVLRGLMPSGYAQKGDQASIVGGAINYVKELEQQLQFLDGQNHMINGQIQEPGSASSSSSSSLSSPSPFSEFLNYPQYSTIVTGARNNGYAVNNSLVNNRSKGGRPPAAAADIEVTMVESSHANLKARAKKRPKQLIKLVSGLQGLRLTILHLNVTTADQTVLYSLSLKVEDDCTLNSADDVAAAVNQIFMKVQEGAASSIK